MGTSMRIRNQSGSAWDEVFQKTAKVEWKDRGKYIMAQRNKVAVTHTTLCICLFNKCLLCARHCARCWGYCGEQNLTWFLPSGTYIV